MTRRKALVTGGSSGVGLSIVRALTAQGWEVHFIGRDAAKGHALEAELNGPEAGSAHFIQLDLSELRRVRDFAAAFRAEHVELHLLANIAGVMLPDRQETSEGLETTMAVGHLSAYVLSHQLAPLLAKARHGRIVNVSGKADTSAEQDLGDLTFREGYSGLDAAMKTVHAKTVMTQALAEQLAPEGIDVNAFSPGLVKSGLRRDLRFPLRHLLGFLQLFMARDSATAIYASTSEDLYGVTGQFLVDAHDRVPLAFEEAYRGRLLERTEALVNRVLEESPRSRDGQTSS